eukprot:TRINITY_DN4105_c0_g1_i3.p2 TRINITY_DN4105_c0_g1~~TRINITY_DN4105_c0_g1_i3.p2  ORF type:complete len:100 (+),score=11.52 TRINITY_DN4105_c0_g1_i3:107-406(+)
MGIACGTIEHPPTPAPVRHWSWRGDSRPMARRLALAEARLHAAVPGMPQLYLVSEGHGPGTDPGSDDLQLIDNDRWRSRQRRVPASQPPRQNAAEEEHT